MGECAYVLWAFALYHVIFLYIKKRLALETRIEATT
jgi:hypothetical protein